jgi:Xaa-Pro dipeptidase
MTRLQRLSEHLISADLPWLALIPGSTLLWLTGIHSHASERPFIVWLSPAQPPAALVPALEAMKAEAAGIPTDRIFAWSDQAGYRGACRQAVQALGLAGQRIGVEALSMRVLERDLLAGLVPDATLVQADGLLAALRLRKDAGEIGAMERAVAVAEEALNQLLPQIRIGMTEREIAGRLLVALADAGADGPSFNPIVAAGPNSASPHAVPGNRPISPGDLLIIDWGARVDDYPSDLTRTFAVGQVDDELRHIHAVVQAANAAGVAACHPGVTGEAIDRAARDVIAAAGYGDFFIHRTGHGLGLDVHEPPSLMAGERDPLPPGAVFTVEPGIYLPGRGGVRIEDNIVLTETGYRCLTSFPRGLQQVG